MNRLLSVAALSILIATPAIAADMRVPVKAAPVVPAPVVYNWTGCYVGAGGGYGMWDNKNQLVNDGVLTGPPHRNAGSGWFGTVQVGCDYQLGSNFVVGAFGDYDFSGIKGDLSLPRLIIAWVGEDKLKSSWAAGGRIGWLPFQQLMVFVSGGYTEARFGQIDFFRVDNGASANNFIGKHTESGWFIGTGYEYGIGWLPGLFWKTEYRFADYGKERLQVFITGVGPSLSSVDVQRHIQTVRSELVWRFNFGRPVVARY